MRFWWRPSLGSSGVMSRCLSRRFRLCLVWTLVVGLTLASSLRCLTRHSILSRCFWSCSSCPSCSLSLQHSFVHVVRRNMGLTQLFCFLWRKMLFYHRSCVSSTLWMMCWCTLGSTLCEWAGMSWMMGFVCWSRLRCLSSMSGYHLQGWTGTARKPGGTTVSKKGVFGSHVLVRSRFYVQCCSCLLSLMLLAVVVYCGWTTQWCLKVCLLSVRFRFWGGTEVVQGWSMTLSGLTLEAVTYLDNENTWFPSSLLPICTTVPWLSSPRGWSRPPTHVFALVPGRVPFPKTMVVVHRPSSCVGPGLVFGPLGKAPTSFLRWFFHTGLHLVQGLVFVRSRLVFLLTLLRLRTRLNALELLSNVWGQVKISRLRMELDPLLFSIHWNTPIINLPWSLLSRCIKKVEDTSVLSNSV